jgi:hypothetical protein
VYPNEPASRSINMVDEPTTLTQFPRAPFGG